MHKQQADYNKINEKLELETVDFRSIGLKIAYKIQKFFGLQMIITLNLTLTFFEIYEQHVFQI